MFAVSYQSVGITCALVSLGNRVRVVGDGNLFALVCDLTNVQGRTFWVGGPNAGCNGFALVIGVAFFGAKTDGVWNGTELILICLI